MKDRQEKTLATDAQGEQLVSGRELHEFLEVATPYHKWFGRMATYGFEENNDFARVDIFVPMPNGGFKLADDHAMKLDMAKEISMIQRTAKGKQARHCNFSAETVHFLICFMNKTLWASFFCFLSTFVFVLRIYKYGR